MDITPADFRDFKLADARRPRRLALPTAFAAILAIFLAVAAALYIDRPQSSAAEVRPVAEDAAYQPESGERPAIDAHIEPDTVS